MARQPTPDIFQDALAAGAIQDEVRMIMGDSSARRDGIQNVPVDLIDDNPFQPRQTYDPSTLEELAASIVLNGLQQPPAGRWVDGRMQLVFGHRRKRAFDLLRAKDSDRWATMPVIVVQASDEDMAARAWTENVERDDLTAIEQATAIQTMITQFGWTQAQVAERLGLSASAVSNKLRLLRAPEEVRTAVASGQLTERQASSLLPLYELPENIKKAAEEQWQVGIKPSNILNFALKGASSDDIRGRIDTIVKCFTRTVQDTPWYAETFEDLGDKVRSATCERCPVAIKRDKAVHCPDNACEVAKNARHYERLVVPACEASGFPAGTPPFVGYGQQDFEYANPEWAAEIFAEEPRCPNLVVIWDPKHDYRKNVHRVDGHPNALIVCQKNGCPCLSKRKAALTWAGDDKATRTTERISDAMIADASPALRDLLDNLSDPVLRIIVPQIDRNWHYPDSRLDAKNDIGTIEHDQLVDLLTKALLHSRCYEFNSPSNNRLAIEQLLTAGGIKSPWSQDAEPAPETVSMRLASDEPQPTNNGYIAPTINREAPEYIEAKLARISGWIDEFQDPGDGLPTPASVAGNFDNLEKLLLAINSQQSIDDATKLTMLYDNALARLAALSDRVQQSYAMEA